MFIVPSVSKVLQVEGLESAMKLLWSLMLLGLLLAGSFSVAQEEDGEEAEEPVKEAAVEDEEAAADNEEAAVEVAEPEGPGTEAGLTDDRQPCAMWMGGVPGTPGHSGHLGRDGRDGHDGPRGEKGDTGKKTNCTLLLLHHPKFTVNLITVTRVRHSQQTPVQDSKFAPTLVMSLCVQVNQVRRESPAKRATTALRDLAVSQETLV